MAKLLDVFDDVTRLGRKLPTDQYLETGKYPIIDQGKEYVSGYFSEDNGIYKDVPAIIFGDHTRVLKYIDFPFFIGADGVKILKVKVPNANTKYLYYRLKAAHIPNTGYNRHFKWLKEVEINLPSEIEQKQIVERLDLFSNLIENQKKQIEKLDELVKSQFIEMFGDPKINPLSFDIIPLNNCISYIGDIGSNGANKTIVEHLDMKNEKDYALMVRFLNFTNNDFSEDLKYISKESYNFFKKSQLFGGELIMCKIGSAGQSYIMPYLNCPVSLGLNQIMIKINEKITMQYLYHYLHSKYGEFLISGCINGAVTKSITKTELRKIPIVLPPIELQNQFDKIVKQTDKSKLEIKKTIEELETLKKSLMQDYFG